MSLLRNGFHMSKNAGIKVELFWITGHVGIKGNNMAYQHAKQASIRQAELIPISYSDYLLTIKQKLDEMWEVCWRRSSEKLLALKIFTKAWPRPVSFNSMNEVVIHRLRTWYTRITRGYLMDNSVLQPPPPCELYMNGTKTVKHILSGCINLSQSRKCSFGSESVTSLTL